MTSRLRPHSRPSAPSPAPRSATRPVFRFVPVAVRRLAPSSRVVAALLLPAAFLALAATSALARKTYRAESYRTEIRVQPDGSLRIREEIRLRFAGGPFTFFHRGLPLRRTDGIIDIASPDPIEVRSRRSRIDITWRFSAARDTVRSFALEYTAKGAVRLGRDLDRLRWQVFPRERPYSISQAAAAVVLPPGWPPPRNLSAEPRGVHFRRVSLPEDAPALLAPAHPQSVVLALGPVHLEESRTAVLSFDLESGYVAGDDPAWQRRETTWRERLPGVLIAASFLLTFGIFWVLWSRAYLKAQLDRGPSWSPPTGKVLALTSPPDDTPPGLVGTLVFGIVESVPILATLLDLARRGVVRFEVGAKRWAWSAPQIRLRRGDPPAGLTDWEQLVLDAVFRRTDEDGSASWSRAGGEIQRLGSRFVKAARAELIRRGDLDPAAMAARRGLYARGIGIYALAAVLFISGALLHREFGPAAFVPALAAILVGAVAMVAGATLYPHTAQGAQRARAWRGFARFLKEATKGYVALDAQRFHRWLPLAAALGAAPAWIKAGKRWGLEPPAWFRSASGDPGDVAALLAVISVSAAGGTGGGGGAGGGGSSSAG